MVRELLVLHSGVGLISSFTADTVSINVKETHLNKLVTSIVIHSAIVIMGGTTGTAHFRIFLQLPDNSSVELDSYGLQRTKTMLKVIYRPYSFSTATSTMGTLEIPVEKPFTILDAVTTLLTKNRDRYYLDPSTGSGCRYWCQVVIGDFIDNKWVNKKHGNCVEEFTISVKADSKYKDVNIPVPAPKGTFY
jgi:hypothetical protein